jgi:ankyrin repeat protein
MNEIQFLEVIKEGDLNQARSAIHSNPALLAAQTAEGLPVVMLAAYYGHAELANVLLDLGAPAGLYGAAALGRLDRLRDELARHPDQVNTPAGDGFSALGLAAFFGHPQAVKLLLASGANPNLPAANQTRVAPLHSACATSSEQAAQESARLLLEAGADPNARQQGGFTPLHAASENGYLEVARLLLVHGAEPAPLNDQGRTPQDYATNQGHRAIVELLESSRS